MTNIKERLHRTLQDAVYYFWVGVGVAFGTVTVVRFLLQPPKPPARARP